MENKYTFKVKKTALHAAGTQVITWYDANTGEFPGKITIKKMPQGVIAILDEKPIGIVQNNDGTPYTGGDFNFDDHGVCVDDYTFKVTGLVAGEVNVMSASVIKSTVEVQKTATCDTSNFSAEIERIANDGVNTLDEITEKVEYMLEHQFTPKLIADILNGDEYKAGNVPASRPKSLFKDPDGKKMLKRTVQSLRMTVKRPVILSGGQSTGKNTCFEAAMWIQNKQWGLLTLCEDTTSDDFGGSKSTDNTAASHITYEMVDKACKGDAKAQAEFEYWKSLAASVRIVMDQSQFVDALQNGYGFCLNEWNMGLANIISAYVNQISDGTGFIFIPGRGRISIHPNFQLVATQNPGFEGTMAQNQATLSRFKLIDFGYPSNIIAPLKAALSDIADKIPPVVFTAVNKLYMETLKAVQSGEIGDACLNIRGYAGAIRESYEWEDELKDLIMEHVVNTCRDEDKAVLAQKVSLHFE